MCTRFAGFLDPAFGAVDAEDTSMQAGLRWKKFRTRFMNRGYCSSTSGGIVATAHSGSSPTIDFSFNRHADPSGIFNTS